MNPAKALATPWNDVAPMLPGPVAASVAASSTAQLLRVLAASVKNWCNVG